MTVHQIFPDYTDLELAQYADKFYWRHNNLVKTHVGLDYKQRRVSVMGEREELLRIDPNLANHPDFQ